MPETKLNAAELVALLVSGTVQPEELTLAQMVAVHNEFNPDAQLKAFQSKEKGAARIRPLVETAREAAKREAPKTEEDFVPSFVKADAEKREARQTEDRVPGFVDQRGLPQGARLDKDGNPVDPSATAEPEATAEPAKPAEPAPTRKRRERSGKKEGKETSGQRGREAKFSDDQKIRVLKAEILTKRKGDRGRRVAKLRDGMTVGEFAKALGNHGRALRDLRRDVGAGIVSVG